VSRDRIDLGILGETKAADFLKSKGYKILARNYRTKLGEIDIVALDRGTVCFVEVKARSTDKFGSPVEAISGFKMKQISRAALLYLKDRKITDRSARFDVVSVVFNNNRPEISLIQNAFELEQRFAL